MKKMTIGLLKSEKAFYPENKAYKQYLELKFGYIVKEFENISEADKYSDLIIFHCGFLPFWIKTKTPIIMEYHSLSVTKFPKFKNILKRVLNRKGDAYIFLSEVVQNGFYFNSLPKDKYIIRGMGVDTSLANDNVCEKLYDFIYMGTLSRTDVKSYILKIAQSGFSIIVAGCSLEDKDFFKENNNVICYGRIQQEELFLLAKKCKYGLNYTPDVYPLNIQDSTKVIEYCALGLKVVTNKYSWVNSFELSTGSQFMNLNDFLSLPSSIENFEFKNGCVDKFGWERILSESKIENLIQTVMR
ncbi:hypothetical protein [Psychromonas ossibalaenae]|uniref:hypothetical protein n=1 Tax=Psychromonas ossibalaenae TaxID=444922 RepID=UPI0003794F32|nr:hypothetical protein [Psychromonas ossibalaenae]